MEISTPAPELLPSHVLIPLRRTCAPDSFLDLSVPSPQLLSIMPKGIYFMKSLSIALAVLCALFSVSAEGQAAKPDRQVAITIADLPAGMADRLPAADITALTAKLLGTLRDQKIPVVGFVNEKKLYKTGEVDERIKALQMWLDYGFELGNHTYSHASLNQVGLKAWEEEVIRGEGGTKRPL